MFHLPERQGTNRSLSFMHNLPAHKDYMDNQRGGGGGGPLTLTKSWRETILMHDAPVFELVQKRKDMDGLARGQKCVHEAHANTSGGSNSWTHHLGPPKG